MNDPLVFTREGIRRVDDAAADEFAIPGIVLMENAARGLADVVADIPAPSAPAGPVLIVCGGGNNAGDGFALARHLHNRGFETRVVRLRGRDAYTGDAATNLRVIEAMGLRIEEGGSVGSATPPPALVVDALLGSGAAGPAREPVAGAIAWINALGAQGAPVIAVDIPSGLDCDNGEAPGGVAVRATLTATMGGLKLGFLNPASQAYTGRIVVVDIGAPVELLRRCATSP